MHRSLRTSIKLKFNKNYFYFLNVVFFSLMRSGKKKTIFSSLFKAVYLLKLAQYKKNNKNGNFMKSKIIFKLVYGYLYSNVFMKTQHVGSLKYAVPIRSTFGSVRLAADWFLHALNLRPERTLSLKLLGELHDLLNNKNKATSYIEKKKYYQQAYDSRNNAKFAKYMRN